MILREGVNNKNEHFTARLNVSVDPPPYGQLFVIFYSVLWTLYHMIICVLKRILQKKKSIFKQTLDFLLLLLLPSGSSFAKGRPLILTTSKEHEKCMFESLYIR